MRPNLVDQKKDFISAFNAKRRGFGGYAPVKQVPSGTKRAAAAALFCASGGNMNIGDYWGLLCIHWWLFKSFSYKWLHLWWVYSQ